MIAPGDAQGVPLPTRVVLYLQELLGPPVRLMEHLAGGGAGQAALGILGMFMLVYPILVFVGALQNRVLLLSVPLAATFLGGLLAFRLAVYRGHREF